MSAYETEFSQADILEAVTENVALRMDLLAKEILVAAMVSRLGGSVTLTQQEMLNLRSLIGNAEDLLTRNNGHAVSRVRNDDGSVTFALIALVREGEVVQ